METYALALMIAIPIFTILVLTELLYGRLVKNQTHNAMDTISGLSSGVTNTVKDSFGVVLIILSYPFLANSLAVVQLENTILIYFIGFIAIDFASYWNHRLSHRVNYFWNRHVIHHSSEEFNLACALRQSISNFIGLFPLFLIPAAFLGVPPKVIATIAPIHLFMQFWYHTRHIPKLGFLEYIIVTPSQHRVHHAINPEYIDKNLGAIFCIWDRMFGTFQEELDDVPPVYGVLKPAQTWNPIKINFQHLWTLIVDAWHTNSWKDRLIIWFKPTGWRPADVRDKYKLDVIEDVYNFEKYRTPASNAFIFWSAMHLVITVLLLMYMLYSYGDLSTGSLWLYGGLIFVGIYGYTSLMDRDKSAVWIEVLRGIAGMAIVVYNGDWFGISGKFLFAENFVFAYYFATIIGAVYFSYFEKNTSQETPMQQSTP